MQRPRRTTAPSDSDLTTRWLQAREAWLASKGENTRRAYSKALTDFTDYCQRSFRLPLWQVEPAHVRAWAEHLAHNGLAPASISSRLASVSGFYAHVLRVPDLYRYGQNPFRVETVDRPRVKKYGQARLLAPAMVQRMLQRIDRTTVTGARDYALLLTFLYTGWRSAEVLGMKWGDIAPNPERPGEYVCQRQGKDGECELAPLPTKVYTAICEYLALADRTPACDDHLWLPLSVAGVRNFANVLEPDPNRPISGTQANNLFRKRLRLAGVADADTFHIHCLRHTFAHAYSVALNDPLSLSKKLHHKPDTTSVYLATLETKVDTYSSALEGIYGA